MFWKNLTDRVAFATGNFSRIFADLEVPPLPQIAIRVLQLAQQPDVDIRELSRLVSNDTGLASKVLRLVNSSAFGLRHRVTDVQQAIVLIGSRRFQSLAVGIATADSLPKQTDGFDRLAFWQDSLQRAVFAQCVAKSVAPSSEGEAFTGALLQNMALPILLSRWGAHYLPVVQSARESGRRLEDVETEQLTWTHAEAGAWMARNWGFMDVLVCCIGLHHSTAEQLQSLELLRTPVAAVVVSAHLPHASPICCDALDIQADRYRELCEATDTECEQIAQLFDVPQPKPLASPLG
jgi:HD-like signal output (HDOD) protein